MSKFSGNQFAEAELDFVVPPVSIEAEIDSFNYHSQHYNGSTGPPTGRALLRMEEMLKHNRFSLPEDWLSDNHIERTVHRIVSSHKSKSAGALFGRDGMSTNGQVVSTLGVQALIVMVKEQIEKYEESEDARYVGRPIKIFQKREPHSISKAQLKRWRLIWGVDLIDRIVDELLYENMLSTAIDNHEKSPLKAGMSFLLGGVDKLVQKHNSILKPWKSFDSKQHDMTTPGWALETVWNLNTRLCNQTHLSYNRWRALSWKREQSVLYGSFVLSNGQVMYKTKPGIQPSGRFTTIDSNSKLVLLYRILYDIERDLVSSGDESVCMGDDTVLAGVDEGILDFLSDFGITWTVESQPEDTKFDQQNFCSVTFHKTGSGTYVPIPLNWKKNLFKLKWQEKREEDITADALVSLCIIYAFDPDHFEFLQGLLANFPEKLCSVEWCQGIVTGYEQAGGVDSTALAGLIESVKTLLC